MSFLSKKICNFLPFIFAKGVNKKLMECDKNVTLSALHSIGITASDEHSFEWFHVPWHEPWFFQVAGDLWFFSASPMHWRLHQICTTVFVFIFQPVVSCLRNVLSDEVALNVNIEVELIDSRLFEKSHFTVVYPETELFTKT